MQIHVPIQIFYIYVESVAVFGHFHEFYQLNHILCVKFPLVHREESAVSSGALESFADLHHSVRRPAMPAH